VAGLLVAVVLPSAHAASGPEVNVSRAPGAQVEPAIAIDPSNDKRLLAGSNSFREGSMRVYTSTDSGSTWESSFLYPRPTSYVNTCASDPGVAIDRRGRQYFSFVRTTPCGGGKPQLFVAARADHAAQWRRPVLVSPLGRAIADDKPAIAVDASPSSPHNGRAYVTWVRVTRRVFFSVLLSWSDDGGRTWSRPVRVNQTGRELTYPSVAVSARGTVYVVWDDVSNYRLNIARSTDGGVHFGPERTAAAFSIVPIPHCGSGVLIRAVFGTCLHANPIVSVDLSRGRTAGRVYVSFLKTAVTGAAGIFLAAFDSRLRRLPFSGDVEEGLEVAPLARRSQPKATLPDQFWPASAVDPSTGALWVCFYQTTADSERRRARYMCTASRNGGRMFAPVVRAASVASDETQPGADPKGYGDYEGLAAANGVAHPIWTDSRDLSQLGEEIYTTRLTLEDLR
jgi:hypothetical protein